MTFLYFFFVVGFITSSTSLLTLRLVLFGRQKHFCRLGQRSHSACRNRAISTTHALFTSLPSTSDKYWTLMNSINLQQRKKVLVKLKDHQKNCTLTRTMTSSREGQKRINRKNFSFMFPSFFCYFVSISCPPFTYFVHYTTFHTCYKIIYLFFVCLFVCLICLGARMSQSNSSARSVDIQSHGEVM